jgi:hypothetical protein
MFPQLSLLMILQLFLLLFLQLRAIEIKVHREYWGGGVAIEIKVHRKEEKHLLPSLHWNATA